jgi:D-arabinan exo alpha-(1,3)/(1,5)-arabinofuranosidase (non-reducing end)
MIPLASVNGDGLSLARVRDARTGRVSSFDQRGRNQDNWIIGPGETRVLADLEGPGAITHIWMTQWSRRVLGPGFLDPIATAETAPVLEIHNALGLAWETPDPDLYRKILLRITWDDDPNPAVLVPLGDFFGVGHSVPANYASALFTVTAKPEEELHFGGVCSVNSYVPMPFARRAVVEVINESDVPYGQYFHVDYELYRRPLDPDVAYFHARWNREDPTDGWGPDIQVNTPETNIANLDGAGNYVVLDTQGTGQYIGCNLSVFHRQGSWWGEGDEMIFIDDDTWPPSLHGTGTEDYFNHAWGMQRQAYPYHGAILHESDLPGYAVSYRLHVVDPVRFASRIRVTIEHGHANHLSDDWASTAYWYQLPPAPSASVLPVAQRLPHRPPDAPPAQRSAGPSAGDAEVERNRAAYEERRRAYLEKLDRRVAERRELAGQFEQGNREAARRLRERFR